jgi:hypothetical protein
MLPLIERQQHENTQPSLKEYNQRRLEGKDIERNNYDTPKEKQDRVDYKINSGVVKNCMVEISKLEGEINAAKKLQQEFDQETIDENKTLLATKNGIKGKVVFRLRKLEGGKFTFITSIVCWCFKSIKSTIEKQKQLEFNQSVKIKRGIIQQRIIIYKQNKLVELNSTRDTHAQECDKFIQRDNAYTHIQDLFGGRENFFNLPVLDISTKQRHGGHIDFIQPEDMTAPIMRGTDNFGRRFVTFLMCDSENNAIGCSTIFERHIDTGLWLNGGCCCTYPKYMYIDKNGKLLPGYDELKTIIETGRTKSGHKIMMPGAAPDAARPTTVTDSAVVEVPTATAAAAAVAVPAAVPKP